MTKSTLRIADLLLLGGVLAVAGLLALSLWLFVPKGEAAVVRMNGEIIAVLHVEENTTFAVGDTHLVVVHDRQVSVESAPCRDQICVNHPPISRDGETIVCLPYAITVTVEPAERYNVLFPDIQEKQP